MNLLYKVIFLTIICSVIIYAQKITIHGRISDQNNLTNVKVELVDSEIYTYSNNEGLYKINNLNVGNYRIRFSHLGYKSIIKDVVITEDKNIELNVRMIKKIIRLSEAKVISTRTENLIREVPLPIEFIDGNKINNTNKTSLSDLVSTSSGITLIKDSPWATAINIRGLSKQNIVYLIDGNRIETSTNLAAGLSLVDLNDIQSIEVVKGGLSSLYGTGATGGVINIQSKNPVIGEKFYLQPKLSTFYNSVNNGFSNSISLLTGGYNWSAKINGSFRKADNTNTPDGLLENSSYKDENYGGIFRLIPFKNLEIKFNYQNYTATDIGIPGGAPFPEPALAKYKLANRELFSSSMNYSKITSNLVNAQVKYFHQTIRREVEIKPNAIVTVEPEADHISDGLLLQTDWIFGISNHLIAGLDFWEREYLGLRTKTIKANNTIIVDKPVPNSKFRSLGFFVQDKFEAVENKLNITVGGRYDLINVTNEETQNPNYIIIDGIKNTNVSTELASYSKSDINNKSNSGNIGLIYSIFNNYDITLNSAFTFRAPSLEERYQYIDLGGIVFLGNPNLEPEKGLFFDLGLRIWEENISFKINGYLNSFNNLVVDEIVYPDSLYRKQNIGEANIYGFDAQIDYNFWSDYVAYGSMAYTRGENLTENTNLPQISPFNGLVGLKFSVPHLFNVDLSTTFYSDQNNIIAGGTNTGGYTIYDISFYSNPINIGLLNLNIIAGVENIFDKSYRNHLTTYRGVNRQDPGRNIFAKFIIEIK